MITRLAPSPTGALHLGNARTFLLNWLLARRSGWKILLRIEDIDGPRIKPHADRQAIEDLRWLGIDYDDGPVYQTSRLAKYQSAVEKLLANGKAYPCTCTRKEVELAASAPHAEDGAAVYPGTCRGRYGSVEQARQVSGRLPAIRFAVPDERIEFDDRFAGPQSFDVARELGDFVIAKADGTPAYQLAVVIDDAEAGVTHIVRGEDLLDSTPRQILIYRALELADCIPEYWHVPLVTGTDGRRLAKRHGDTRLSHYRELGVPPGRILELLAKWSGIPIPASLERAADLLHGFDPARIPTHSIVFHENDDAWLKRP
jgi:glutamyl-tRNA synthetase